MLNQIMKHQGLVVKETAVGMRAAAEMQDLPLVSLPDGTSEQYIETYKKLSWVYVAVNAIARNAATVPLVLMNKKADGSEAEVGFSPVMNVLKRPLPPYFTGRALREWTIMSLLLTGKVFWEVQPSLSNPKMIFPLHPHLTVPIPDSKNFVKGFAFTIDGKTTVLKPENVFWAKFVNPDNDYDGLSPMSAASMASATDLTAIKMNLALLFNQARPAGILKTDSPISPPAFARLKEQFHSEHGGPWKSGRPLILESGLDYKAVGLGPRDMEYLDGRKFSRDEILAIYGVPPTIAGVKSANYATAKVEATQFWEQAVQPVNDRVNEAIDAHFFPDEKTVLKGDYSGVMALQEDVVAREGRLSGRWDRGVITTNEYRGELGLDPFPTGEVRFVQGTVKPLDTEGLPVSAPSPPSPESDSSGDGGGGEDGEKPEEDDESMEPEDRAMKLFTIIESERRDDIRKDVDRRRVRQEELFARDVARLFKDQRARVMSNLRTFFEEASQDEAVRVNEIFKITEEIEIFRAGILPSHTQAYRRFFREAMKRAEGKEVKATDVEVFIDFGIEDEVARSYLADKSFTFSTFVNNTTQRDLRRTLTEGFSDGENIASLQERVQETFAGTVRAKASRALAIARTEIGITQGVATVNGYREVGVDQHEWLSAGDGVVRDGHLIDGQVRKLTDRFSNGLLHPGDPSGDPANIIHCRCTTLPVFDKRR